MNSGFGYIVFIMKSSTEIMKSLLAVICVNRIDCVTYVLEQICTFFQNVSLNDTHVTYLCAFIFFVLLVECYKMVISS